MSELQKLLDRIQVRGAYEALFCFQVDTDAINAEAAQAGLGMLAKNFTADHVRRDLSAALARTGVRMDRRSATA